MSLNAFEPSIKWVNWLMIVQYLMKPTELALKIRKWRS